MKKVLLTLIVALAATTTYAQLQSIDALESVNRAQTQSLRQASAPAVYDAQQQAQRRADAGQSTYFTKPAGGLYYQADKETGGGYGPIVLVLPAFDDYCFTNMSPNPTTCYWTVSSNDVTDYADDNGNLWWSVSPNADGYLWYAPVLWNSSMTESYELPNYRSSGNYGSDLGNFPYLTWLGFNNITEGIGVYGALDNYNISGTGTYTSGSSVYTSVGIRQTCPKPASALYFDELYIIGRTFSGNPMSNGAELSLEIYDITDANNPVLKETLTATNDDYIAWNTAASVYGGGTYGTLTFVKKGYDALFGETIDAVTIDYPFEVRLYGFDNSDIDFGPAILYYYECDADLESAHIMLNLPGDSREYYVSYTDSGLAMTFHGIMDVAKVADELIWSTASTGQTTTVSGYNTIIFSDDGQTCYNDVPEDRALWTDGSGSLYADITCPWFDEDDATVENYYFSGLPEWVTGYTVYDDYYDLNNYTYNVYIKFTADILPSDTEYRAATAYLNGRGYQAEVPIYLLQGNIPEGIDAVAAASTTTAAKGTYNLAGQRVSDGTKGLVIRDGKKVLVK